DQYGVNSFDGGDGNDVIQSLSSAAGQTLIGGLGNDNLENDGGAANSTLSGGDGDDYIYAGNASGNIITGGIGDDTINSVGSGSTADGGDGDDDISGGGDGTTFTGGDGNDKITIFRGSNVSASGGIGNDIFIQTANFFSATSSSLTGGAGSDTYRLQPAATNTSTIADFAVGQGGDVIDVAYMLGFATGYAGPNPFATGHLQLVQSGADTLLQWDANGATGGASFTTIATLTGVTASNIRPSNVGGYNPSGGSSPPVANNANVTVSEDQTLNGQATA